jgi:hypothetical protein
MVPRGRKCCGRVFKEMRWSARKEIEAVRSANPPSHVAVMRIFVEEIILS